MRIGMDLVLLEPEAHIARWDFGSRRCSSGRIVVLRIGLKLDYRRDEPVTFFFADCREISPNSIAKHNALLFLTKPEFNAGTQHLGHISQWNICRPMVGCALCAIVAGSSILTKSCPFSRQVN
jgi:hypothetical protein